MQTLGVMQLLAIVALLAWAVGAGVSGAVVRGDAARWRNLEPAARQRRLYFWAFLPAAAALLAGVVALLPSMLDAAGLVSDHCNAHPDHHFHLCLVHANHLHPTLAGWIAVSVGAVWPLWSVGRAIHSVVAGRRRVYELLETAEGEGSGGSLVVPSERIFAFTAGWWSPTPVVSRGMHRSLSDDELEAVVAHEQTHADYGDPAWRALLRLATALHIPAIGRSLRREASLAREERCDRKAAERLGDRCRVADALVAVERGAGEAPPTPSVVAATDGELEHRVRALLDSAPDERSSPTHLFAGIVGVGIFVFHYRSIHHALETVFAGMHGTFH